MLREWISCNRSRPSRSELLGYNATVRALCSVWEHLRLVGGILCRVKPRTGGGFVRLMVVPAALQGKIFQHLHAGRFGGHFGITKTVDLIRQRFYWPGCKSDIRIMCRECIPCQQVKNTAGGRARLVQIPVREPLDRVALDILGELTATQDGYRYILVVGDYFTKWTEAYPLRTMTALEVADTLMREFITRFGAPRYIHSDQGAQFESELFKEMARLVGTTKTRTTPYAPWSDGLIERYNRSLLQILRILVNENQDDWDTHLPYVTAAYRCCAQESTQMSPYFVMFGREMPIPLDLQVGMPARMERQYSCQTEYVIWLKSVFQSAFQRVQTNLKTAARRQKNNYDARARPQKFQVGDYVWRYYQPNVRRKLGKGWTGPWKIIGTPTSNNCQIQRNPGEPAIRVHADALKRYFGREPRAWRTLQPPSATPSPEASDTELVSGEEPAPEGAPDNDVEGPGGTTEHGDASESEPEPASESASDVEDGQGEEDSGATLLGGDPDPPTQEANGRGKRLRRPPIRLDL